MSYFNLCYLVQSFIKNNVKNPVVLTVCIQELNVQTKS